MQGFDDKALILFPRLENYEHRTGSYKYQFKVALNNLIGYLKKRGIQPHVFYTDDVAREINSEDFVWVSSLSKADRFFTAKHCNNMSNAMSIPMVEFDNMYNEITAKDPGSLNMSESERFEMVLRHCDKAVAQIIPTYKIVIHFMLPNKAQYKVISKPGDGKIRIHVNANTFQPRVYMGGSEENACDVLAIPYGNRNLDNWEVE